MMSGEKGEGTGEKLEGKRGGFRRVLERFVFFPLLGRFCRGRLFPEERFDLLGGQAGGGASVAVGVGEEGPHVAGFGEVISPFVILGDHPSIR